LTVAIPVVVSTNLKRPTSSSIEIVAPNAEDKLNMASKSRDFRGVRMRLLGQSMIMSHEEIKGVMFPRIELAG
jgi:hypothetical protein